MRLQQQRRRPNIGINANVLAFCHKETNDMLNLGCTLPNLANVCLHKSTGAKFYPFTETNKDVLQKIREDMVGGPSIVPTRIDVVDDFLSGFKERFVRLLLALTQANFILILCVSPCEHGYTHDGDMKYDTESIRFKPQ